jgi:hypothetical protein
VFCAAAGAAAARDINVNLFINHGSAFRNESWVSVDVLVENRLTDVEGWLEVRTYDAADRLQSPVYRVPAASPRESAKRFRVYCRMEHAARIEARLYHGRREVDAARAWMRVQPLGADDFLCLVLDDRPEHYGFLSTALHRGQNVRFYRESLNSAQFAQLPDYPQCYEPFDLIVFGNADPDAVAPKHRELLARYVRGGGVLAICTGEHGDRVRGTWLEQLAGATLGEPMTFNGMELAERVFPEAVRAGASADRAGRLARLTPFEEGVRTAGGEVVLATLRPLGQGAVAMLAVDAQSGLLQECAGYQALWRSLAERRSGPVPLGFATVSRRLLGILPAIAGVELLPLSSVVRYLVIYFAVAIVGNWLFWSWMKRREYAWLCLVFFSIGFTAYAMVYGTQGRATRTELEQIEVLRLPPAAEGAPVDAAYTGFVGLLARGSGRYSGTLAQPAALVQELEYAATGPQARYGQGMGGASPFYFVQDDPARVEDLRIGASEMRFVRVDARVELPGGCPGEFTVSGGRIRGGVRNETGRPLRDAYLSHAGRAYRLNNDGERLTLDTDVHAADLESFGDGMYSQYSYWYNPNFAEWLAAFRLALLSDSPQVGGGAFIPITGMPPLIVAYAVGKPFGDFESGAASDVNLQAVLIVAETRVRDDAGEVRIPLPLSVYDPMRGQRLLQWEPGQASGTGRASLVRQGIRLERGHATTFDMALPRNLPAGARLSVEIAFAWDAAMNGDIARAMDVVVTDADMHPLEAAQARWAPREEPEDGLEFRYWRMHIDDAATLAAAGLVKLTAVRAADPPGEVFLAPMAALITAGKPGEDFDPWQ